jgi:hypothetical protein
VVGFEWMKKDFEPYTRDKAQGGYRLLLIDGHISHLSYDFCEYAEKHKIIVLRLPPHTTHALQPCNVGVFAPLSIAWKKIVNRCSRDHVPIQKQNFLALYHEARTMGITPRTVGHGWAAAGLYPRNNNAIPDSAYAPAINTTSQAAQPLPAVLSSLLTPIKPLPAEQSSIDSSSTVTPPSLFALVDRPKPPCGNASQQVLYKHIEALDTLLDQCEGQMSADHAQKLLMDNENGALRSQMFDKRGEKRKKREVTNARHMTSHENMIELAKDEWKEKMKIVWAETVWKERKDMIKDAEKAEKQAKELRLKEAEAERKSQERAKIQEAKRIEIEAEQQRKATEKAIEQARKAADKEMEQALKAAEKEAEKARKAEEREAERVRKVLEKEAAKARKVAEKEEEKMRKAAAKEGREERANVKATARKRKRRASPSSDDEDMEKENTPQKRRVQPSRSVSPSPANSPPLRSLFGEDDEDLSRLLPRPRPRPRLRRDGLSQVAVVQNIEREDIQIDPALL